MSDKEKATPRPWSQRGIWVHIPDDHGWGEMLCASEADAELIVKAVNSHDALVKERDELRKALERIFNRQWSEDDSNAGPVDCTPKEKGLLKYVGQTSTDAFEALSRITGGEKAKEAEAEDQRLTDEWISEGPERAEEGDK